MRLLLMLLSAFPLWGTALSVTVTGDDANPCTIAQPCLTLARAEAVATNGDTVAVSAGTYSGNVTFAKGLSWIASGAVIVQPSSSSLTITGNSTASWVGFEFRPNGQAYTTLMDTSSNGSKTFTSCSWTGNPSTTAIEIQGSGAYVFTSPTVTITAAVTHLVNASTAGKSGSITMTGGTLTGTSTSSAAWSVSVASYTVDLGSNSLTLSSGSQNADGISIADQPTPNVHGNTVDCFCGTSGGGIRVYSTGTTVGAATVTGNTIYMRGVTDHYCILVGSDSTDSGALKLNGSTIDRNACRGYRYFNPATDPSTMQLHGIIVGHQINAVVTNNNVAGALYTVILKGDGCGSYTWTSGYVAYNVGWNNATHAASGGVQGLYAKAVCGTNWYNNTIWLGLTSGASTSAVFGTLTNTNSDAPGSLASNNTFRNNLIGGIDSGRAFQGNLVGSGNTWDYDLYYATNSFGQFSGGGFCNNGGSPISTFAGCQSAGYDTHGQYADPLFVDAANGDFRLAIGSPALRSGVYVSGVTPAAPNRGAAGAVVSGLFPSPGGFRW